MASAGVAAAQVGNLVGTSSILTSVRKTGPDPRVFLISESDYLSIAPAAQPYRSRRSRAAQFWRYGGAIHSGQRLPFNAPGRFVLVDGEGQ